MSIVFCFVFSLSLQITLTTLIILQFYIIFFPFFYFTKNPTQDILKTHFTTELCSSVLFVLKKGLLAQADSELKMWCEG